MLLNVYIIVIHFFQQSNSFIDFFPSPLLCVRSMFLWWSRCMGTHINAWLCACVHACGDQRKRSIVLPCCSLCECLKTGSPPEPKAYRVSYTCCPVNCWDLPVSGPNAESWGFELRSSGPRSWKESALPTKPYPQLHLSCSLNSFLME